MVIARKQLTEADVVFDPASTVDEFGRVFHYDNRLFRAVRPAATGLCKILLEHAKDWEAFGLVSTWLADIELEGYPMVLEHERIQFQSYCTEWLPEMLRDAAVTLINLNKRLVADGFATKDSHPWNIFFDYTRPVFIDFGSIVPLEAASLDSWHEEFTKHIWTPLCMFAAGRTQEAYEYMSLSHAGAPGIARRAVLGRLGNRWLRDSLAVRLGKPKSPEAYFDWMLDRVEQLSFPEVKMKWSEYDQQDKVIGQPESFAPKQRVVHDLLLRLDKNSLLDVGSNRGWYTKLAGSLGYAVVAADNDIPALTHLYREARADRRKVLPAVFDFADPLQSYGSNDCYPNLLGRAAFDVTLALAIVHHLVFSAGMAFAEIAERIALLTSGHAVVEFIPNDDEHVSKWDKTGKEWYTEVAFLQAFLKHFRGGYEVLESSPAPRRIFLFNK